VYSESLKVLFIYTWRWEILNFEVLHKKLPQMKKYETRKDKNIYERNQFLRNNLGKIYLKKNSKLQHGPYNYWNFKVFIVQLKISQRKILLLENFIGLKSME